MAPGDSLLNGRFALQELAGAGGMARVYRGLDRETGGPVAIKVAKNPAHAPRFNREVNALSGLSHPNIVRYFADGVMPDGARYLVMEWLEGEDLGDRLADGPLGMRETLTLARQIAEALAFAHSHGVVHRDLKPANIWVAPASADGSGALSFKLLDFGVSRVNGATSLTLLDAIVGTPGYMAPEQVRGRSDVAASADVFSLGCVLHECLTGRPPFAAQHVVGMLARILYDPPPQVRDLRTDVPEALAALIQQMLTKDRSQRPADGAALVQALEQAGNPTPRSAPPSGVRSVISVGASERRLLTLLVVRSGVTLDGHTPDFGHSTPGELEPQLRALTRAHGGVLEVLADGTAIVSFEREHTPADQAVRAAQCALAALPLCAPRPLMLVTGRTDPSSRTPIGHSIDRAAASLHRRQDQAVGVLLDELTADLLDGRCHVQNHDGQLYLTAQPTAPVPRRRVLASEPPCVGRDFELRLLESAWQAACDESAQVVVVTAPPGTGKSRLGREFSERLARGTPAPEVWVGRGDPLRSDSALDVIRRMLRGAFGLPEFELTAAQVRAEIAGRLGDVPVSDFLLALFGVQVEGENPALAQARDDSQRMVGELTRAFVAFIGSVVARTPLVLILEDLHWADLASARFCDLALRDHPDARLLVLGLARPELHTRMPALWRERGVQHLSLKGLSPRASGELVGAILGPLARPENVRHVVQIGEGNPFYLEELARSVALAQGEHRSDNLPETVLAMIEARLDQLDEHERLVLRAASVFGESFWMDGVSALLGSSEGADWIATTLTMLVERELIVKRMDSRFAEQTEFGFRHALVREGAYARLTDEDARLAHAAVASWLARHGELDPGVLALHHARGGDLLRAAHHYLRAAIQARRAGDLDAVVVLAERGLACAARDQLALALYEQIIGAFSHRGEFERCRQVLTRMANELPLHALPSMLTLQPMVDAAVLAREVPDLSALVAALDAALEVAPTPDLLSLWGILISWTLVELDVMGQYASATPRYQRTQIVLASLGEHAQVPAWQQFMDIGRRSIVYEDPQGGLVRARASIEAFGDDGDPFPIAIARLFVGIYAFTLGAYEEALDALTQIADKELGSVNTMRHAFHVMTLLALGRPADAEACLQKSSPGRVITSTDRGRDGCVAGLLALHCRRDLAGAIGLFAQAAAELGRAPTEQIVALVLQASCMLFAGALPEAAALVERADQILQRIVAAGYDGALIRTVAQTRAEVLLASGRVDDARVVLGFARARLMASAARIDDAGYRTSFLTRVPENARLQALAAEWLATLD